LIYRIQVIASPFHRGVFGVSYLPYVTPAAPNSTWVTNFLTKVVDLSATRDVEFEVPYTARYPWMENTNLGTSNNGQITIYPISPLLSNGSVSPVDIFIYVRAGKDYDVARPGQFFTRFSIPGQFPNVQYDPSLSLLSDVALEGPEDVDDVSVAGEPEHQSLIAPLHPTNTRIFFGERFTSIKELCNRYVMIQSRIIDDVTTNPILMTLPNAPFPAFCGQTTAVGQGTSYTSYASYFRAAFLAERGGIRYKVLPFIHNNDAAVVTYSGPNSSFTSVSSITDEIVGPYFTPTPTPATSNWAGYSVATGGGSVISNNDTKSALEFEFPDVDTCRFRNPREYPVVAPAYSSGTVERPIVVLGFSTTGIAPNFYQVWAAAADDYSLHGFQYVPKYTFTSLT